MSVSLHIGLDDTDSPAGGCTTYIAAVLVEKFLGLGCTFIDYPNLIRLNPNVPWKTRGNGALCLRILCQEDKTPAIEEILFKTVLEESEMDSEKTDPAVAILQSEIPDELEIFSKRALTGIVTPKEALNVARKHNIRYELLKGERGLIGALAAIGNRLRGDHTYELIAYRDAENHSRARAIDPLSIQAMDNATRPNTFNNIDYETRRILITPRGNDPILYGIRGETAPVVLEGHKMIKTYDKVERWVIFRTNHGTDAHLAPVTRLVNARPYCPIIASGMITVEPTRIEGGHIVFRISDDSGEISCAAYQPTGNFRNVVTGLVRGDLVQVFGGVRPASSSFGPTVNLEKIRIVKLAEKVVYENPPCPQCGVRMDSEGRYQGFRCRRCGIEGVYVTKRKMVKDRQLQEGLYLPPARAHRHLTKPLSRYGREKTGSKVELIPEWNWSSPG